MHTRLRLLAFPFAVTLAGMICRWIADAAGIPGAPAFNISWLIPFVAVYFTVVCLRRKMGYGGFLGLLLLYTAAVRGVVILIMILSRAAGVHGGYFAFRSVFFGMVLPHLIVAPTATFILGTFLWPIIALFIRGRRVSYRGVAGAAAVVLLIIFVGLPYAVSRLYTGGLARRSFKATPQKYGLVYHDITLTTPDGLHIRGWYLPHERARGTVVFCHGLFKERSELLEQAVFMHRRGFRALLFDFRHHGKSDGDYTSFGYFERRDVEAAVRYAKAHQGAGEPVILWGISLGAANALLTAAEDSTISGVIAESSFYSVDETLRHDLGRMFRLPQVPFAWLVERITEWRLGIDIDDLDIGNAAARIHDRPVLLVGGTADKRMPISNNTRLFEAIPGAMKDRFTVAGAGHADAWRMATEDYKASVMQFLSTYFDTRKAADEAGAWPAHGVADKPHPGRSKNDYRYSGKE